MLPPPAHADGGLFCYSFLKMHNYLLFFRLMLCIMSTGDWNEFTFAHHLTGKRSN